MPSAVVSSGSVGRVHDGFDDSSTFVVVCEVVDESFVDLEDVVGSWASAANEEQPMPKSSIATRGAAEFIEGVARHPMATS